MMTLSNENSNLLSWNELNQFQKEKVVNAIRSNCDVNNFLVSQINNYVEGYICGIQNIVCNSFENELSYELKTVYGIKDADIHFNYDDRNNGLCFDNVKRVDEVKFLKAIGLSNMNIEVDELTQWIFDEYVNMVCVDFIRLNQHYDNENSIKVRFSNYNTKVSKVEDNIFDLKNYLLTNYNMNSPNLSNEEEVKVFNFLQTMEKAFDEKLIEKATNKWYHDFCLKNFNVLLKEIDSATNNPSSIIGECESLFDIYEKAIKFLSEDNEFKFDLTLSNVIKLNNISLKLQ